jgi:hypothetical protein
MRVPHVEVLADHIGPESCGGVGNDAASGGKVDRGKRRRAIELRNHFFQVPTLSLGGEGNIDHSVISELWWDLAESEYPGMRGYLMRGNREIRVSPDTW